MSAKLRLYVKRSGSDGGSVYPVSNDWQATTLTWNNARSRRQPDRTTAGAVKSGTWKELDLGNAIPADGTYSFGVMNHTNTEIEYVSSRGSKPPGAQAPQLVLALSQGSAAA